MWPLKRWPIDPLREPEQTATIEIREQWAETSSSSFQPSSANFAPEPGSVGLFIAYSDFMYVFGNNAKYSDGQLIRMEAAALEERGPGRRPRPKSIMIVAVVFIVLVGFATASYYVGYNYGYSKGYNSGLGNGQANQANCSNFTSSAQSRTLEVLLMQPGSTGLVCVLYSWGAQSPQRVQLNQQSLQSVVGRVWSIPSLISTRSSPIVAGGVNIAVRSFFATPENETVVYTVRTAGNSSGVYTWWAPDKCPGFPLVVGTGIASAQPSLIEYYAGGFNCPVMFFPARIVGTSGVSVQYLQ